MDHEVHGPEGVADHAPRPIADLAPHHGDRPRSSRGRRCGSSSTSPTAGPRAARCPPLRDQVRGRAGRRPLHRLGRAWSPSSAHYLDDFWDTADVEIDGDAELQQAVRVRASSTCCRPAPAPSGAPIAAKGLTGPGYDGHTFWDTETFVPAGALAPGAGRGGRRAALAPVDPRRWPRERGRAARAARARRSRGARSAARSARATGRPARRRSTSTPTSPTPCSATSRPPATSSSSGRSGSSCWSRPPGCGARSATTTRPGSSASTA